MGGGKDKQEHKWGLSGVVAGDKRTTGGLKQEEGGGGEDKHQVPTVHAQATNPNPFPQPLHSLSSVGSRGGGGVSVATLLAQTSGLRGVDNLGTEKQAGLA